ncbi:MAG: hypothetical protein M3Y72_13880 [Acidobacteriota bacterium]|nr:hypothetical protein [Acidobacteriota bacterium]
MTRIPLGPGFAISFLADGRPKAHVSGRSDTEVISDVEDWLEKHLEHEHAKVVSQWLIAKYLERDARTKEDIRATQRDDIKADIERVLKSAPLSPHLKKLVREVSLEKRYSDEGLSESE